VTDHGRDGQFLFFCLADAAYVVAGDQKVLGSAQRRRKGAILQHGSLVLRRSEFAPEFPGIFDLSPQPVAIEIEALLGPLSDALQQALGIEPRGEIVRGEISVMDRQRATHLAQTRYASPGRRSRLVEFHSRSAAPHSGPGRFYASRRPILRTCPPLLYPALDSPLSNF
jgi:hypothetical protein